MSSIESTSGLKASPQIGNRTLLIVGPLPPPIGGSPLTVKEMIEELAKYISIRVTLVSTSPSRDPRKKMTGFNWEKVQRLMFILSKYLGEIRGCDAVLVFAKNLFAFTIVPLLLFLARLFRKPFYIKPVGGDLDLYLMNQRTVFRKWMVGLLRTVDGVFAQTRLLQASLAGWRVTNTHYLPGFRSLTQVPSTQKKNTEKIRVISLSHITRDKGILVLLDALRVLAQEGNQSITCDFYGPIHEEIQEEFIRQL